MALHEMKHLGEVNLVAVRGFEPSQQIQKILVISV